MSNPMIDLYPVAIIQDRYNGVYSGGDWIAIANADERTDEGGTQTRIQMILEDEEGPHGADPEASNFWAHEPDWVAVGVTPDQAVKNLVEKVRA